MPKVPVCAGAATGYRGIISELWQQRTGLNPMPSDSYIQHLSREATQATSPGPYSKAGAAIPVEWTQAAQLRSTTRVSVSLKDTSEQGLSTIVIVWHRLPTRTVPDSELDDQASLSMPTR